ncbi:hypothetical protein CBI35_17350 [Pantoea sp. AV62]|nr:hypothetical protein HA39_22380 [Pantoea brenneri]OXM21267.1 hypothetical protein CBI35_17350 [Pantoea sp. AV62]
MLESPAAVTAVLPYDHPAVSVGLTSVKILKWDIFQENLAEWAILFSIKFCVQAAQRQTIS